MLLQDSARNGKLVIGGGTAPKAKTDALEFPLIVTRHMTSLLLNTQRVCAKLRRKIQSGGRQPRLYQTKPDMFATELGF